MKPLPKSQLELKAHIITVSPALSKRSLWQEQLAASRISLSQLLEELELSHVPDLASSKAASEFHLIAPMPYRRRMRKGDPHDPLLLQVLPQPAELLETAGFTSDPVGDNAAEVIPGLLHKYQGRVLLIAAGSCAINCRYCFRREFGYQDSVASRDQWHQAIAHIRKDPSINEVILSGGDPLVLSNRRLKELVIQLNAIDHVTTLRIHSRLPIVIPDRIDDDLLELLNAFHGNKVMVIHSNHARELDGDVEQALGKLRLAGLTLLNQSVLLKGINDNASVMIDLSQRLFNCGVLPYYLHQLDRVKGASHFLTEDAQALELINQMRAHLPGYLVPRLVREIAGEPSKTPITHNT